MKKIRLNGPTPWKSSKPTTIENNNKQELREQLLAEISELRMQLRMQKGTGTLLEISRRQTYNEMIKSRQRFIESLGNQ